MDQKTGSVSVVWYDTREDPKNVKVRAYIATSLDGGVNFGPNIPVADAQSDKSDDIPHNYITTTFDYGEYIGMAVDNGVAHVVWSDNSNTHATSAGYFAHNPVADSTLTLNGVTWKFVKAKTGDYQTLIGADQGETLKNLVENLNDLSDPKIMKAHYAFLPGSPDPNRPEPYDTLIIQATDAGPSGGDFTLAATAGPGGGSCAAGTHGTCFINFPDGDVTRLIISLNLKTDQVPVPVTPGERMLVVSMVGVPGAPLGTGRILRYDVKSGAFMNEFVANCLVVNPLGNCAVVPGAAEDPVDMVFGPDRRLYVADTSIGLTLTTSSGIAVKRYNRMTGVFGDEDDPYAAFIRYDTGGLGSVGGLAFGPDSNLYVSDFLAGRILRYHGQTGDPRTLTWQTGP